VLGKRDSVTVGERIDDGGGDAKIVGSKGRRVARVCERRSSRDGREFGGEGEKKGLVVDWVDVETRKGGSKELWGDVARVEEALVVGISLAELLEAGDKLTAPAHVLLRCIARDAIVST
jgi:hypothetical protein